MRGGGGEPSSSDSSLTTRACPLVDPDRLFQVFFWGQLVALWPFSLQVKHLPSLKHFSHSTGVSLAGAVRFCRLLTSMASGSLISCYRCARVWKSCLCSGLSDHDTGCRTG